ncbi:MAG: hypothetical protein ABW185_27010, partial [Sedimenticola sp.]
VEEDTRGVEEIGVEEEDREVEGDNRGVEKIGFEEGDREVEEDNPGVEEIVAKDNDRGVEEVGDEVDDRGRTRASVSADDITSVPNDGIDNTAEETGIAEVVVGPEAVGCAESAEEFGVIGRVDRDRLLGRLSSLHSLFLFDAYLDSVTSEILQTLLTSTPRMVDTLALSVSTSACGIVLLVCGTTPWNGSTLNIRRNNASLSLGVVMSRWSISANSHFTEASPS